MADTPFFPSWRGRFHRRPSQELPATFARLRRCTLDKLEERLGPLLAGLDALDPAKASARERPYSIRRTWWCFLWQMLGLNVSCRTVVRQLQAMFVLEGRPVVDECTGAYCQARERLPESLFAAALKLSAQVADQRVAVDTALQGRVVKVCDGTTLSLPDTAENQNDYPQTPSQSAAAVFPSCICWWCGARAAAVCSTTSRAITTTARCACCISCCPPSRPRTSSSTIGPPGITSLAHSCASTTPISSAG